MMITPCNESTPVTAVSAGIPISTLRRFTRGSFAVAGNRIPPPRPRSFTFAMRTGAGYGMGSTSPKTGADQDELGQRTSAGFG